YVGNHLGRHQTLGYHVDGQTHRTSPPQRGKPQLLARDHQRGFPITSTPAGALKVVSSAETGPLRSTLSNITVDVCPNLSSRIIRFSSSWSNPNNARRKSASLPR